MRTYQSANPLARANTLRSIPLIRPATAVLGHSNAFKADWALQIARRDLAIHEAYLPHAYAALGSANKVRGPMRRTWQAKAFRAINTARADISTARKAVAAAEAAMLARKHAFLAVLRSFDEHHHPHHRSPAWIVRRARRAPVGPAALASGARIGALPHVDCY